MGREGRGGVEGADVLDEFGTGLFFGRMGES